MKKKISLPIVITIALIVAAIAFSLAYIIATNSMNAKLTDLGEKQALFSTLSEVDNFAREKSFYEVDEEILTEELCRAYAKAYDGRAIFLTPNEVEDSPYTVNTEYTVLKLADGSAIVILTEEQYNAGAQDTSKPVDEETTTATTAE